MATIYDVAKLAGVSPKTVSRALNGEAPVSKSTRATVEASAAQLGYVPSNAARMMRAQRSGLFGLLTGGISEAMDMSEPSGLSDLHIVQGVQRRLLGSGKTLMIADTGGDPAAVPALVRTFMEHRVDGLFYVASRHQEVDLDLPRSAPPLVLINGYDRAGTPSILPDDRHGQEALTADLIARGHRRIAYLTLNSKIDATRLRRKGYDAALRNAGLPLDPALVIDAMGEADWINPETVGAALEKVLALPDPPTVVCFGNDQMAMQAYGVLRARGVRIPDDISVAGFDNHRTIAETLYPPLTTAELPYAAMGEAAADYLLAHVAGTTTWAGPPLLIDGPVHWRASVQALNSAP